MIHPRQCIICKETDQTLEVKVCSPSYYRNKTNHYEVCSQSCKNIFKSMACDECGYRNGVFIEKNGQKFCNHYPGNKFDCWQQHRISQIKEQLKRDEYYEIINLLDDIYDQDDCYAQLKSLLKQYQQHKLKKDLVEIYLDICELPNTDHLVQLLQVWQNEPIEQHIIDIMNYCFEQKHIYQGLSLSDFQQLYLTMYDITTSETPKSFLIIQRLIDYLFE